MDYIMHEWRFEMIKSKIDETLKMINNEDEDAHFRLGYCSGSFKIINDILDSLVKNDEDTVGRTIVSWVNTDVIDEFNERFGREPTSEELDDILNNYLDLDGAGEESANDVGFERIYSALDDWESDNPQE